MKKPVIFRKRYIPDEIVDISSDELLYRDNRVLVTRWKTIKPRADFAYGISCTFLEDGYKISRFFGADGSFRYWYCDILDVEYREESDTFVLLDLLVDVKVMPDGKIQVLDAEELAEALEKGLISQAQCCNALRRLNRLLSMIQAGEFPPEPCRCSSFAGSWETAREDCFM